MVPIDPSHNYTHCGGPRRCRYCADILSETPERSCQRRTAEDRARGLRTAAQHDYTPPDPYAEGLRKLRAERRWPEPPATPPLDPGGIPDPYAAGLERMRKEQR